ncbi:uncharacterized protein BDW47DRAFT_105665 [Aspergillus candidus]|uniref:Secreted protein n=1 Tax=Aspergillus candidus TaxID=41067 RepID=A0A2I2FBK8_ASPCN|nr:hypothetical protein BDW47DRAFT_105665 [Aspergillus candidus]PLB38019.1 hypothetical protein BDW47DRAFT_105665 [Aspergillus candidus]
MFSFLPHVLFHFLFSFFFFFFPFSSPAFRPDSLLVHWIAGRLWGRFFPRVIGSFREACGDHGTDGVIGWI